MIIPIKYRSPGLGEFESGDKIGFEHGGTNATSLLEAQDNLGILSKVEQTDFDALEMEVQNKANLVETTHSTTSPSLLIANGTIQTLTLGANGTLSADLESGQSMTVLIPATSYTLNTSAFTVVNTFTLSTTNLNVLVLFKVGTTSYLVGINK